MAVAGARTLVVEDDRALRKLLASYLRDAGFQVLEADNGLDALSLLRCGSVDIALVDVGLPELDGFELVRRVRRESTLPIILVTGRGEETSRVIGLDIGADDCVVKPFSLAEIAARIRAHLRRVREFASEQAVLRSGSLSVDLGARRCFVADAEIELTRREFDLLAALLRYQGRIHTREQLLELVWQHDHFTLKTVDVHVAGLRRKLGSAISIATVRGVGYRLDPA